MKLSVIIVNYNVRHFLEQCLHSVLKASAGIDTEIFVVDNASVDGSCHLVREKFPSVNLMENRENKGYSAANNQAIRASKGEFILLLNPDTVVSEDTFRKALSFMEATPLAGGLGVRMIDGKGRFLPESKRGLPTPWVAFYKIFGISRLFPQSKRFGKYHLTYLSENEIHEVDVLCGAFMLLRRSLLDITGWLDESFFMYGEDIDLSYRIQKAGYGNYYFPETTIIHYKGESTKKDSINYVKVFYNAMIIFARKHFSPNNALAFSFLIHLAVWFRAAIAILQRIIRKIYLPILDALLAYSGFLIILPLWEKWRFDEGYYPAIYLQWVVPVYILFWLTGIKLSGGYRRPVSLLKIGRGLIWGTIALLIGYSLIPEDWRFSRAVILLGTIWALIILPLSRLIYSKLKIRGFELDIEKQKRIAIAGHSEEVARVRDLLGHLSVRPVIAGYIALSDNDTGADYLGSVAQLRDIIRINKIDEIVFCGANLSSGNIIKAMLDLTDLDVDYKIAPPESLSIIGSNSIHTAGDLYLVSINAISSGVNRTKKRLFDIAVSLLLLLVLLIQVWFVKGKRQLLINIVGVMAGRYSWVGYAGGEREREGLPALRKGILSPAMLYDGSLLDTDRSRQINILYAKDYNIWNDLGLVSGNLKKLDTPPNG